MSSGDFLNPKLAPYLALGDGSTDDTAALNACFADARSTSTPVYLPPGIYQVSNLVSTGGFLLTGAGAGISVIRTISLTGDVLPVTSGMSISDVGFKSSIPRTSGTMILFDTTANDSRLSNFFMSGHFIGIEVRAAATVRIRDGYLRDGCTGVGTTGILFTAGNDHYITRISMDGSILAMPESGIRVDSGGCINLTNCDIIRQGYDLWIRGGFSTRATACYFDTATRGVFISPVTGPVGRVVFVSCWTSSHTGNGFLATNGIGGGIGSLQIVAHQAILNGNNGLAITGGAAVSNVSVVGGLFSGNHATGIYAGPGVSRLGISDTNCGDVPGQIAGNGQWGIFVDSGTGDFIRVVNNDALNNGAGSVHIGASGSHIVNTGNLP